MREELNGADGCCPAARQAVPAVPAGVCGQPAGRSGAAVRAVSTALADLAWGA